MEKGSNSQASSGHSYDVFLSFRGPDTRHQFTDCLYHGMYGAGILVYRDTESLPRGKKIRELLRAIEDSKFYIPIFSATYASSPWCLRELAHMVECTSKSNGNKEILPIFLDVEPDVVKLRQNGDEQNSYIQALSDHQKEFSTEVGSWKKALIEVGKIRGWNWQKHEGQGDLIRSIIRNISFKLKIALQNVTEHLVGIDDRVEAIIKMLDVESEGVRFLIIHGMGGVGKSTLAKVVFNQLYASFHQCCFLADVRKSSQGHGLVNLQKQLLCKLLSRDSVNRIDNLDDGINMMSSGVLKNKKVLIVLDDVDEQEQLKHLAKEGDWFGSGSRIIITTRNQSVLAVEGEAASECPTNISIYEVQEMEFDHALKLFSRHAFRRDSPPDDLVSLSEKIVHTLGKLPLSLEITGASLIGRSEAVWVDTWKKLQEAPPKEVQKKLMITYDRLDHKQREVFLDIACIFVNRDKTYPFYMWNDCGYCPHEAIEVLVLMSLTKIKDDNTFWMHDQVRDLGRAIVREENFKEPCERSRVWNYREALSILKQKEGSRKIEALSIVERGQVANQEFLSHDEFANLRKLRFVEGDGVALVGDFNNLLPNLRWLSWTCFGGAFQATDFVPTNLVVFELSSSGISEERISWIRAARKLKVLNLNFCKRLRRAPDLSKLESLERLRLRGCEEIKKLPNSIGRLQLLIELDLSATGIIELPSAIWLLEKLEVLNASDCENLTGEIPEEIGRLSCLRILDLSKTKISRLPTAVSRLSNLQKLELCRCFELRHLPELPPNLTSLTWGNIATLERVAALPTSISTLSQLKKLNLSSAKVGFLPQLPSSLRELRLENLEIAQSPDFSNLKNLSTLAFQSCSMKDFSGIFDAELEELCMYYCKFRRLDALFQLEMKRLTSLTLHTCEFLPEVLDLSHMKNLREVHLHNCKLLVEIRGLEELGSLSSLKVNYFNSIERMSDLSKLRKLRSLEVGQCPKLRTVEGLNHLESLKELWIYDCGSLESLADTSNLDLECSQIVLCEQLPDRHNYCKRGSACGCRGLSEWLLQKYYYEDTRMLRREQEVRTGNVPILFCFCCFSFK